MFCYDILSLRMSTALTAFTSSVFTFPNIHDQEQKWTLLP